MMVKRSELVFDQLELEEEKLRARFRNHPVVTSISALSNEVLEELLLQRFQLTMYGFDRFYNTALIGLHNSTAKAVARSIFREEYPVGISNHREDAVHDLEYIGIDRERILTATPTETTFECARQLQDLVVFHKEDIAKQYEYDIRAITALRFAGEALPGDEFVIIANELSRRYGLERENSAFYWPHTDHDQKQKKFGQPGRSHADRFGIVIAKLYDESTPCNSVSLCRIIPETLRKSCTARMRFYDQFEVKR